MFENGIFWFCENFKFLPANFQRFQNFFFWFNLFLFVLPSIYFWPKSTWIRLVVCKTWFYLLCTAKRCPLCPTSNVTTLSFSPFLLWISKFSIAEMDLRRCLACLFLWITWYWYPFAPRNAFSTSYWHGCRLSLSTSWLQCPISDFISTLTALWFAKLISAQTWHLFWQQTFSTSPPPWFLCIVTEQVCSNGYLECFSIFSILH